MNGTIQCSLIIILERCGTIQACICVDSIGSQQLNVDDFGNHLLCKTGFLFEKKIRFHQKVYENDDVKSQHYFTYTVIIISHICRASTCIVQVLYGMVQ